MPSPAAGRARNAYGRYLASDYLRFAGDLIPGQEEILAGWKAIGGHDASAMTAAGDDLQRAANSKPAGGPLKGLLFGSPVRFLTDLVLMLRQRAATEQFAADVNASQIKNSLSRLVSAVTEWQQRHGYECNWSDPVMRPALQRLNAPAINEVLAITYEAKPPFAPARLPKIRSALTSAPWRAHAPPPRRDEEDSGRNALKRVWVCGCMG